MSDQHLKIDKAGVLDVGAQLRANVDQDITPHRDRITQAFMHYPVFGERSGSPVVQAAVNQYFAQMRAAVDFLDSLVYQVGVMAEITQAAVTAYEHADTLSADEADALFLRASAQVRTQLATAEADGRQAEREQLDLRDLKRGTA